jgi:hypothetical protein
MTLRRTLAVLLTLAAMGLGSSSTFAGGPTPLTIQRAYTSHATIVEQESPHWAYPDNGYNQWHCTHDGTFEEYQTGAGTEHPDNCVHDPTGCTWDVDALDYDTGHGYLRAGSTATGSKCVIADDGNGKPGGWAGDRKTVEAHVYAPVPTLTVRLADNRGHSQTAEPVSAGNGYRYAVCLTEDEPGPFDPIPDSNGGTGLRIDYTLSVTAGARNVRDIAVHFQSFGWLPYFTSQCNPYGWNAA